ncbi:carbohydrate binding domain-containing protein [Winogradskyella aurantiaca]|uniref:carbohydrate binding domain-containing protein n=1 Tax=Winogradskyella aurantiaca TaxID=2219558 RepID=UPI001E5BD452|nr:carbohydrate binding domain-containing protein [Winogradskyella aurantiaca]
MKRITYFIAFLGLILLAGCDSEDRSTDFINSVEAPSNVDVLFRVVPDNTGLVFINPSAENAAKFDIDFGDGSEMETLNTGNTALHVYEEGVYTVVLTATGINGLTTRLERELVVAFIPPQNLEVVLENIPGVSKTVRVSATADFGIFYEVDFGDGSDIQSANMGDEIIYEYAAGGFYNVVVTAYSAAEETTVYEENFEVIEINEPLEAAPNPTAQPDDVIAIYSDSYTPITTNEFPTEWSDSGFEEIQIDGNNTIKYTEMAFTGIVTDYGNPTDLTGMDFVHFDYWTTDATTLGFKIVNTAVDPVEEDIIAVDEVVQNEWVSVVFSLDDYDMDRSQVTQLLFDALGNRATIFIDNLYFSREPTGPPFDDGLLENGDFELGADPWIVGVDDNAPAPVVTVGGNTYYSVDVTSAGQPFSVNVSQKLEIIEGETYVLTFDAWSNVDRSIIAGIGLSGGDFSNNSEPVNITTNVTNYSLTLTAGGFGAPDARVLFDVGAEVGVVNIDNVSLKVFVDNLLVNGDFEAGADPWIVGVDDTAPAPVVTVGGNTYYSVDVTSAGQPFSVNVSQKLEIIQGETYTLTFDAWSDVNRSIIAGIGLSGGDFSNNSEPVNITPTVTNYTLTLPADGFGAPDARVLFDVGAEVGMVNIDNVVLSIN